MDTKSQAFRFQFSFELAIWYLNELLIVLPTVIDVLLDVFEFSDQNITYIVI